MRLKKVQYIMWDLWAKNAFALKIAPPGGHFLCATYSTNVEISNISI